MSYRVYAVFRIHRKSRWPHGPPVMTLQAHSSALTEPPPKSSPPASSRLGLLKLPCAHKSFGGPFKVQVLMGRGEATPESLHFSWLPGAAALLLLGTDTLRVAWPWCSHPPTRPLSRAHPPIRQVRHPLAAIFTNV